MPNPNNSLQVPSNMKHRKPIKLKSQANRQRRVSNMSDTDSMGFPVNKSHKGMIEVRQYEWKGKNRAQSHADLPFLPSTIAQGLPKSDKLIIYSLDPTPKASRSLQTNLNLKIQKAVHPSKPFPYPELPSVKYSHSGTGTEESVVAVGDLLPPSFPEAILKMTETKLLWPTENEPERKPEKVLPDPKLKTPWPSTVLKKSEPYRLKKSKSYRLSENEPEPKSKKSLPDPKLKTPWPSTVLKKSESHRIKKSESHRLKKSEPYRLKMSEYGSNESMNVPMDKPKIPKIIKPYRYVAGRQPEGPKIPINPSWPEKLSKRTFVLLWDSDNEDKKSKKSYSTSVENEGEKLSYLASIENEGEKLKKSYLVSIEDEKFKKSYLASIEDEKLKKSYLDSVENRPICCCCCCACNCNFDTI